LYRVMNEIAGDRLLGLARGGDDRAFESLVQPLLEPSFRLACGILLDRAAAEDAVQEATLKAWRALPRLRPDTPSLRPWFLTIVANQCRSMRRSRWSTVVRGLDAFRAESASAEALATTQVDIGAALRRLGPRSRAAVVLRYYLDLSYEEMAEVMGGTAQAAKSRLHRAVRAMRVHVEIREDER
jgi:RNA polymerase sigma-70 factor (ECF subfamily)